MKYCGNCGTKLNEDSKFCSKCGKPTKLGIQKIKEDKQKKNEEKNQKVILNTGIALIVIASAIFTLFSFKNISMLFKTIFLSVEAVVFIYMSILLRKRTKSGYKALWMIGVILIPIILVMLTSNDLLGNISFMNGAGLYIYLSLSFLICSSVYVLSYKFIGSKIYLYLSYIFTNAFVVSIVSMLRELTNIDVFMCNVIAFTSLLGYNLLSLIIFAIKKDSIISKTFINYLRVVLAIASIFMIFLFSEDTSDILIYNIINTIIYVVSSYIIVVKSKGSILNVIMPIFILLISILFVNYILSDYNNISIFMTISTILLQFFISYLINNKYFKISTYIVAIMSLIIMLCVSLNYSYMLSFICFTLVLASTVFTYKIESNRIFKSILSVLIMINIYFVTYSMVKSISLTSNGYICLITSVLYSLMYVILKTRNSNMYKCYECLSYIFLVISSLFLNTNEVIINVLHEAIWIYYFLLKLLFDDNAPVRNFLLSFVIFNLFLILVRMNVNIYYILLSFSALFTLIGLVSNKVNKLNKDVFNILAVISILCASLYDFSNYVLMSLCVNVLLYSFIYYSIMKDKKINFAYRYIYVLMGFIIIYKIFGYFIDVTVISSLLTLLVYTVILVTMFLLRVEDDRKLICYTPIILLPYIVLINNIGIISDYTLEFILTPIIIYIFLFTEKVINFKDNSLKHIFQLLLLSLVYVLEISNIHNDTVLYIYSLLLSVIYVVYGIVKKDSPFVTFGCITLLITTILLFFEVSNSLILVFSIIFVGISLITYISVKESKK